MKLFDAHCHLQLSQYDADREAVLARMRDADMGALVIGVDYETSQAGLELAASHDFLWASIGLHPNDNPTEHFDISKYEVLAKDPKVVAIGECGLDYFRSEKSEGQKERFEAQIELALTVKKPLVVHCRNAHDDMVAILQDYMGNHPGLVVVIHFFTGSGELAQKYLDLGCYLSFPGPITYTDMYNDSIRLCPPEKMLIETDSPFAAPVPNRGKRNEPAFVVAVAAKIAAVKGMTQEEVARQTVFNSQRIFKIDK
jgi:TatD DNase family protein